MPKTRKRRPVLLPLTRRAPRRPNDERTADAFELLALLAAANSNVRPKGSRSVRFRNALEVAAVRVSRSVLAWWSRVDARDVLAIWPEALERTSTRAKRAKP